MNNPIGSNIPKAREILNTALNNYPNAPREVRLAIARALELMVRAPACKKTPPVEVRITRQMRARIYKLARAKLSHHKIANAVGLPNSGRVSEILNGLR
jgi:hypothetical protein